MEKQTINIDEIIKAIDNSIDNFIFENNIDNIKDINGSIFNACLMDIHKNVFYNGILKANKITQEYNYKLVYDIANYYIYLCFKYNKLPTLQGFMYMTGIDDNTIHRTGSGEIASSKNWDIRKTILKAQENALENGLHDGKKQVIGDITILNHRFDWQTTAAAHGIEKRPKKASELPDFRQFAQQKEIPETTDS